MPEYTVHPEDIMIKFTGSEDRIIRMKDRETDRLSDKFADRLSEREIQIIELIKEDPGYTTTQMANALSITLVFRRDGRSV